MIQKQSSFNGLIQSNGLNSASDIIPNVNTNGEEEDCNNVDDEVLEDRIVMDFHKSKLGQVNPSSEAVSMQ